MKAPPIFVVVRRHRDFSAAAYLAWFFDGDEAEMFAAEQPRTEFSGCSVEEVPGTEDES